MQPICHLRRSSSDTPKGEANMLRTLLLLIALIIVIGIALIASGYVNLNQRSDGSVSIETKDVEVGTTTTNVQVPVVKMETRQVETPSVSVTNDQGNIQ
jgi:hypothetical protein